MSLVSFAAVFAAGILIAFSLPLPLPGIALSLALGAAVAVLLRHQRVGRVALLLATGAAGALAAAAPPPLAPVGEDTVYSGAIARPVSAAAGGRLTVLVDVDAAGPLAEPLRPFAARVLLHLRPTDTPANLLPGDRVRFRASARAPRGFANPGVPDRALAARGRGVDLVAVARPPGLLREPVVEPTFWRAPARLRARGAAALRRATRGDGDGAGLLLGLVLGERGAIRPDVEAAFRRAGVSHILSVSGLHLAAVVFLLYRGVRWLWLRLPSLATRLPADRLAALVAAPAAVAYALLTGGETATLRALGGALLAFLAVVAGRRAHGPTLLAAAALAILAVTPAAICDPSFQLSFAAAGALALAPSLPAAHGRATRLLLGAVRLLLASLLATLATAPLTALHFGVVQPAGVVTNLVVVPLAEVVLLPAALLATLLATLTPLADPLLRVVAGAASFLVRLVELIASVSPVLEPSPPRPIELAGLGLALVGGLALPRRRLAAVAAGLLLCVASVTGGALAARWRAGASVVFLDVGHGDAAVIEAPGGETYLIDSGGASGGGRDPGEHAVWPFLRARRISHLDIIVLSHPHPDHIDGLAAVTAHVSVGEVWIGGDPSAPAWRPLLATLRQRGIVVRHVVPGEERRRGDGRLLVAAQSTRGDENERSLVVRYELGGRAVLFTGDIGGLAETELASHLAHADVLKVPHHGSRRSATPALLERVRPHVAIISADPDGRYRLPAAETVAALHAVGAEVLETGRRGAVSVAISPSGDLDVETALR